MAHEPPLVGPHARNFTKHRLSWTGSNEGCQAWDKARLFGSTFLSTLQIHVAIQDTGLSLVQRICRLHLLFRQWILHFFYKACWGLITPNNCWKVTKFPQSTDLLTKECADLSSPTTTRAFFKRESPTGGKRFLQGNFLYDVAVVQLLSHVWLFVNSWTVAPQAPLSFTISQSLLNFMFIELVMLPYHLILCHPLLLLPSIFPSIRVFSNESALPIRRPKYWSFSFSISTSNEYSGLVSLLSKGQSKVFSSTTVWKYQFFSTQSSLWSNSHIHTWLLEKPIVCFDYTDLCRQSNISAF